MGSRYDTRRILFSCSQDLQRSPTAVVYRNRPDLHVRSAGVDPDAARLVTATLLEWGDLIFVFEPSHWQVLSRRFPKLYPRLSIEYLDIPDEYGLMAPELVFLLAEKLTPHLGPPGTPDT